VYSAVKNDILKKIRKMTEAEIKAALAFVETLESINKRYPDD
jgi:hypothetical protein